MTSPEPRDTMLPETDDETAWIVADDFGEYDGRPQAGIGPVTLRELLIVVVWAASMIASFIPSASIGAQLWSGALTWVIPLGLPTVAVFLIVLRRFSPEGIRRVGSLGIDQFASVVFSVAALHWSISLWQGLMVDTGLGTSIVGWAEWVLLTTLLLLVVLTVAAPIIPGLKDDFEHRTESLAHRNANPVRPIAARPAASAADATHEPELGEEPVIEAEESAPEVEASVPETEEPVLDTEESAPESEQKTHEDD
ncbi:hypothetical protein [Microbacterium sp. YY-01]|uniref:hypothetical protein n=1 Tax=Microbacterium sp. YY-01 TaxID=3421634 RepID=UPI003D17C5B6